MWPTGYKSALVLTFDFDAEEVWLQEDPANAERPSILSLGTFGAKVGLPLILDVLDEHEVKGTFFVPALVARRHPEGVGSIAERGHELGWHGYRHSPATGMSADEEEEELLRARDVLEEFTPSVVGHRVPSGDMTRNTLALLEKNGFQYSSKLMDDIRAYQHEGSSVIELPISHLLADDIAFWCSGSEHFRSPSDVVKDWKTEIDAIAALGGCSVLVMHPQLIGRPSRLAILKEIVAHAKSRGDTWIARGRDVASHVRNQLHVEQSK